QYINNILFNYLNNFYTAYLDNIIIYSKNKLEYKEHVYKRLRKVGLYINLNKYKFLVIEVKYLRLIITTKGVRIDPKKVYIITK
ncbi:uncharacterized protein K441DRAFT_562510, partial [Cenococcum geophilum 1.58]|uniref:uncharacterized protein n=1 Tax=Cenococcum geophilum 1.58 TaxID=794803 RepID=UPI00358E34B1